ncbi:hypothetical protein QQS21_003945 [Conoideocrella luteorostrata]|uniref:Uncharacterized protein n=1 Tax=Conoideocrella luteorostrata TaxID=1105319 RepID=A0AAJ0FVZ1_9HYPO|nr:hypothetical protein QQS21_003945 [Conoideocrella luteorostrata]
MENCDEVYPLHRLDMPKAQAAFQVWTFLFNDQLDAKKLCESLSRLAEIGDWRKIGGRIRRSKDGYFEIHCPRIFTVERPAVTFSHDDDYRDNSISEHPLGSRFPRSTNLDEVTSIPYDSELQNLAIRTSFPTSIDDVIGKDAPILSLHVVTFSDSTIVGLSWPHILTDAFGIRVLLHSWSLVLAGRESDVPPVLSAKQDIAYEVEKQINQGDVEHPSIVPAQDLIINKHRMSKGQLLQFLVRYMCSAYGKQGFERRLVYLPKRAVDALVDTTRQEADNSSVEMGVKEEGLYISRGDAITAWFSALVYTLQPKPRDISILSLVNLRYRLQPLLPTTEIAGSSGFHLQNLFLVSHMKLVAEVDLGKDRSVGSIAVKTKRQAHLQTQQDQLTGLLRLACSKITPGKNLSVLYGGVKDNMILVNNMIRMDFFTAVDFSPAVARQRDLSSSRKNPPGTIISFLFGYLNDRVPRASALTMLGSDHSGGHYLIMSMEPKHWHAVDAELLNLCK